MWIDILRRKKITFHGYFKIYSLRQRHTVSTTFADVYYTGWYFYQRTLIFSIDFEFSFFFLETFELHTFKVGQKS